MSLFRKIRILFNGTIGWLIKVRIFLLLPVLLRNKSLRNNDNSILVSLTSYGRRVTSVLPYTLYSILNQTLVPSKIIVWLDSDHWNETNLPKQLQPFIQAGVEFKFYDDIRSYKKLIPSLISYPDKLIVTIDDDLYYHSHLISNLYQSYLQAPHKVHCSQAHEPKIGFSGELESYDKWDKNVKKQKTSNLFPTGGAGTLYPPGTLSSEVLNRDRFLALAPTADDVWFWAMQLLNGTERVLCNTPKYYDLDFYHQLFHKGTALAHENNGENRNDIQLNAVLDYYHIKLLERI